MKNFLMGAALLGALLASPVYAVQKGDAARGEQLSSACAGCHGADGNGDNPQFPRIAGQYPDYMLQALKAYKTGARNNAIMAGIVANLSQTDMEDLAAYFAEQKGVLYQRSVLDD